MFETLKAQFDISTREGKAQLANQANSLINKMHNSLFKDLMIEELSSIVGLSQQALESKLDNRTPASIQHDSRQYEPDQNVSSIPKGDKRLRLAVALLVQNPQLATQLVLPDCFAQSANHGLQLLHELSELIKLNPEITTAALVERYRGTDNETTLQKLSIWSSPDTDIEQTRLILFTELIEKLHFDDRYNLLFDKQLAGSQLTDEEKLELQQLTEFRNNPSKSGFQ